MTAPYFEDADVTLYLGDCREILPTLEAGTVDLVLTDPPYGISGRLEEKAITVAGHAPFMRDFGAWDQEFSPAYLLAESHRLLRPGGSLIAFMAHEWVAAYSDTPLEERKFGVWAKTNPAPRVRPGYQNATEFWTWQTKPGLAPTWNGGFTQSNVITTPNAASCEGTLVHPTQKPLRLMAGFVARHSNPGDLILDPFAGSGTTARAAKDQGRRCILIELDEAYCEIAAKRLSQSVMDLAL